MNNLNEEEILEVENQYWVNMWNDLRSLKEDERFKRVILDGYFKDKAINGVSLLARDDVVSNGHRSAVMEDLIAISSLEDFFISIENLGSITAEDSVEDNVGY